MTTMQQVRGWQGPAILSYGFRPFFLAGALYAALLIALWVPWFLGFLTVPSAFNPIAWHAHELLFGYVGAIIAGFLLTAIPNWTGRLPVAGVPLAGLFALWLVGRIAVGVSEWLDPVTTAVLTLMFPLVLIAVTAREIVAGRNWRNVKVIAAVAVFTAAQALFHYELWRFGWQRFGAPLAIAATVLLIIIIGGRIVPSFTLNWVKRANPGRAPVPFNRFDRWVTIVSGAVLAAWVVQPAVPETAPIVGGLLLATAGLTLWRQARWCPDRTLKEPLVAILHIGHVFVPLGFLFAGAAVLADDVGYASAAVHTWTVGAIGVMTLAVMTRASLGHTGRALTAGTGTTALYLLAIAAALVRASAGLAPQAASSLYTLSAALWCAAFLGFAVLYGPALLRPRETG